MAKFTKDGDTKIADNKETKDILLAAGWVEDKPKPKAKKKDD